MKRTMCHGMSANVDKMQVFLMKDAVWITRNANVNGQN